MLWVSHTGCGVGCMCISIMINMRVCIDVGYAVHALVLTPYVSARGQVEYEYCLSS